MNTKMTEPMWVVHAFVCINERDPETKRVSCGRQCNAMGHVEALKEAVKQRGLQLDVRAQKAGCMEVCEHGPAVAVYPQGWFFRVFDLNDCAILADVLEGLSRGAIRSMVDLSESARMRFIAPQSAAHVRARIARERGAQQG